MFSARLISILLLAGAAGALHAAPPPQQRQPDPLDAAAPTRALTYDSAFAGYKGDAEPKVTDWKATNAAVANAPGHGGHAGHDMSKMKPEDKPAVQPAKDPHADHRHE
jgi:hypothetical protein